MKIFLLCVSLCTDDKNSLLIWKQNGPKFASTKIYSLIKNQYTLLPFRTSQTTSDTSTNANWCDFAWHSMQHDFHDGFHRCPACLDISACRKIFAVIFFCANQMLQPHRGDLNIVISENIFCHKLKWHRLCYVNTSCDSEGIWKSWIFKNKLTCITWLPWFAGFDKVILIFVCELPLPGRSTSSSSWWPAINMIMMLLLFQDIKAVICMAF